MDDDKEDVTVFGAKFSDLVAMNEYNLKELGFWYAERLHELIEKSRSSKLRLSKYAAKVFQKVVQEAEGGNPSNKRSS